MAEREHHANSLAIDKYKQGEDFDQWVSRFELAVGLAHLVNEPDKVEKKRRLCMDWLPLKIDDATYMIFSSITAATWEDLKLQMSRLLTDPQEKYDYFAGRNPIIWDGKESFHSLCNRIKMKVNKYFEQASRGREYFLRFRAALTPEYRKAIDIGCGDNWDIEEALRIAIKVRLAETDLTATGDSSKTVAFAGAAMSDDRLKTVEMAFQGMTVKVDNLQEQVQKMQAKEPSADGDRRQSRSQSRGRDERDDRDRYERSPRDGSVRDRRDSRGGSPYNRGRDRYRAYDDRDRQGAYGGRDDSRYRYDRSPSNRRDFDRRPRFDRSPSYNRQSYDRQYRRESPRRFDNYRRDEYRSDSYRRDDYRDRRSSQDRWGRDDSRDRAQNRNWEYRSRPSSRDRPSRDQGQSNAVAVRSSAPRDQPPDNQFRGASFDEAVAAAMYRLMRDDQQGN